MNPPLLTKNTETTTTPHNSSSFFDEFDWQAAGLGTLDASQRESLVSLIKKSAVPPGQWGALLDELSANLAQGKIANPVAWAAGVMKTGFVPCAGPLRRLANEKKRLADADFNRRAALSRSQALVIESGDKGGKADRFAGLCPELARVRTAK